MITDKKLKEQIEFYIDQLDLLEMQPQPDQVRIAFTIEQIYHLSEQYLTVLNLQVKDHIEEVDARPVETIVELLQKRQEIFLVAQKRANLIEELFLSRKHVSQLITKMQPIIDFVRNEASFYQNDVKLIEQQLEAMKEADKKETELLRKKEGHQLEVQLLRMQQIPCSELNQSILDSYQEIFSKTKASSMTLGLLKKLKQGFKEQLEKSEENLALSKQTEKGAVFQEEYEKKVKKYKLELDKTHEQIFISLWTSFLQTPIPDYLHLFARTKSIQDLVNGRIAQINKLYKDGVVKKEEYSTVATQVDHSLIFQQQEDLQSITSLENAIWELDEQLDKIRDHIKGKQELEHIFKQRKQEKISTNQTAEPEAVDITPEFNNNFENFEILTFAEIMTDLENRKKVTMVSPASSNLIAQVSNHTRKSLLEALTGPLFPSPDLSKTSNAITDDNIDIIFDEDSSASLINAKQDYKPSIGDKIHLNPGTKIYTSALNAISGKEAYDALSSGLEKTDLFVTRGAIIDQNHSIIYTTSEYRNDLTEIVQNIGLQDGTYEIALGCSFAGPTGEFIGVLENQLNPNIEVGWVNSNDPNLSIVMQLHEQLEKGGQKK